MGSAIVDTCGHWPGQPAPVAPGGRTGWSRAGLRDSDPLPMTDHCLGSLNCPTPYFLIFQMGLGSGSREILAQDRGSHRHKWEDRPGRSAPRARLPTGPALSPGAQGVACATRCMGYGVRGTEHGRQGVVCSREVHRTQGPALALCASAQGDTKLWRKSPPSLYRRRSGGTERAGHLPVSHSGGG